MYKEELIAYKRINTNISKEDKKISEVISINSMIFYICAFFASRVVILKMFMPFGLAFFIAAYGVLGKKAAIITGVITSIGYITTFNNYLGLSHGVSLLAIMGIGLLIKREDKFNIFRISAVALVINSMVNIFIYYNFISGSLVLYDILISLFEGAIVVAFGFIFSYGVPACFFKKDKKEITNEELICMALIIAIAVAGTFDITYMGVSLKNIAAFSIAVVCGYKEGAALGSAMGITLGLVSGISDTTMPFTIGIFGFCGLISGVFREFGKIFTSAAFVLSAAILSFYTSTFSGMEPLIMDAVIGAGIFLLIPKKKLNNITLFKSSFMEENLDVRSDLYIKRVSDIMSQRLNMVSGALGGLSNVLEKKLYK